MKSPGNGSSLLSSLAAAAPTPLLGSKAFPRLALGGLGVVELLRAAGFCCVTINGADVGGDGNVLGLRLGGVKSAKWTTVPPPVLTELATCLQMLRVRCTCIS